MRFEFYTDAIADVPKLSVDGTVDNAIHFSHWQGNNTPIEVKADTSTEIALNLVASPNRDVLTEGIKLVTTARLSRVCSPARTLMTTLVRMNSCCLKLSVCFQTSTTTRLSGAKAGITLLLRLRVSSEANRA